MSFQVSFSNIAVEQFVLQHSVSRLKTAAEGADTTFVWGDGGGDFAIVQGGGFNTQEKQNELASDRKQVIEWREKSRTWETIRVYQNNDSSSENWVDVARCVRIQFQSSKDQTIIDCFLNPAP